MKYRNSEERNKYKLLIGKSMWTTHSHMPSAKRLNFAGIFQNYTFELFTVLVGQTSQGN
jgi:hypothetical protein